jgi:hypothetical protein
MAKAVVLFYDSPAFGDGTWAAALKQRVAAGRFIPDWRPTTRIWRGTYIQWVQFEPPGWSGPLFWSGKPAFRASSSTPSKPGRPVSEDALYVGYYVERGVLTAQDPDQVIDEKWHWHGFHQCLTNPRLRAELDRLLLDLPEGRRTIWMTGSRHEEPSGQVHPEFTYVDRYHGERSLDAALARIKQIPPTQWLNVMLGSRFTKAECLVRQADLVGEFRNPTVRANEVRQLVEGAMPGAQP